MSLLSLAHLEVQGEQHVEQRVCAEQREGRARLEGRAHARREAALQAGLLLQRAPADDRALRVQGTHAREHAPHHYRAEERQACARHGTARGIITRRVARTVTQ